MGIPSKYDEFPPTLATPFIPKYNPLSPWTKLIDRQAITEKEPQELELFGSAKHSIVFSLCLYRKTK